MFVYSAFTTRFQADEAIERYFALGTVSESEIPLVERRTINDRGRLRKMWCVTLSGPGYE